MKKLTKNQLWANDSTLDQIERILQDSGSDFLYDEEGLTVKEIRQEWQGYLGAIRKIKRLANQLKVPE